MKDCKHDGPVIRAITKDATETQRCGRCPSIRHYTMKGWAPWCPPTKAEWDEWTGNIIPPPPYPYEGDA